MDVILVPGLWLDASSWDEVLPALVAAGHSPHPLTLPGVGASGADAGAIGIDDWVRAVVDEIDRAAEPVVLVGHSGGGSVVWGAADARADRVARIVFVDTYPPADGGVISEFPVADGVVPFPGWDAFEDADIADLPAATRDAIAARARTVPARVPTDPLVLHDERRLDIPATMLTGTFPAEQIRAVIAAAPEWARDLARVRDLEIVELHSGHWPQFSQPARLGELIVAALPR